MAVFATPTRVRAVVDDEVRGLWVVRSSLSNPASVSAMVSTAKRAGFNTLLVQVRGRGEAYYRSDIEPRASAIPAGKTTFDPLAHTIAEARRAGLRVHAWVNVNLVASAEWPPTSRAHVIRRHPEWLMIPKALAIPLAKLSPASPEYLTRLSRWARGAAGVEGLFLSPLSEEARAYSISVIQELATRYDIDGVHLDYVRFPSADFDYSAGALAAFRAHAVRAASPADRARLDRLSTADPLAWTNAYPEAWAQFRRESLDALVRDVRRAVREVRPAAVLSAAVFPQVADAKNARMQDWPLWASRGWLDAICPMVYTPDADAFARTVGEITSMVDAPVWAGIGAYRLPASRTAANVRAARRLGAAGVVLFSYDSLAGPAAPTRDYFAALRAVLTERATDGAFDR